MALDEDIRVYLESMASVPRVSEQDLPVSELRRATHALWADRPAASYAVRSRDLVIPGRDGNIAARHYEPPTDSARSLLMFFHGGGFVFGNLDTHDEICR